jgi:MFS family permease
VIFASSLGTVFEWYDFYLYGTLAAFIGAAFFNEYPEATRNIFVLLAFAAGFLVRPFGALVFGRIGDLVGRKYTFLVTIVIMGASTFLVGILPGSATLGIFAPIILIALRMLQGLAARRVNMAVLQLMLRNMLRTIVEASSRHGSRPRQRSACSCRCW